MVRRGTWISTPSDHPPIIRTSSSGARPINTNTTQTPVIGVPGKGETMKQVSDFRREMFNEKNPGANANESIAPVIVYSPSYKANKKMREDFTKNASASVANVGSSFGQSSSSSTVRQAPEVYSPLFQMANLQLPRDRITMNAWNRNFYITHPLVHNCINLHATYPISKINIKCKDAKIQQFFEEMAEDMDLMGALQAVALQFWTIGEVFAYTQLDENTGRWKSIECLNPDYIHVKKSPVGGGYSMSMRPDNALLKLIQSSSPDDRRLVEQIDPEVVYHVRKGNNIPLDNFHVSHLKNQADPSDIHGTSIIVSIYKDLMLYDQLRESKFAQAGNLINPITLITVGGTSEGEYHPTETDLENYRQVFECHDEETEVLTDQGFKRYDEVMDYNKQDNGTYQTAVKPGFKVACFNKDTEKLEYHIPSAAHLYDYNGDMFKFSGKKVDICVTPNHRMLVGRKLHNGWSDWEVKPAEELSMGTNYRLCGAVGWDGIESATVDHTDIALTYNVAQELKVIVGRD